ncbi:hypothetical protein [Mesorhizobium sp. LjNodule214]|uniref:hypothetical protein n=1 Tax=Mesorhizobium sp. LjNodule214 TaxID=3342252 RepID=UPI003ECC945A
MSDRQNPSASVSFGSMTVRGDGPGHSAARAARDLAAGLGDAVQGMELGGAPLHVDTLKLKLTAGACGAEIARAIRHAIDAKRRGRDR